MINKKNIWFLTLFSLILVLSVYYITMPNDLLLASKQANKSSEVNKEDDTEISESSILVALRVDAEEDYLEELEILKNVLTNTESTTEEKNNAFEQMKNLNNTKGEQESLEKLIKEKLGYDSFIKIDSNQIRVVIASKEHNAESANKVMRLVQSKYTNKMYITVKFQGV